MSDNVILKNRSGTSGNHTGVFFFWVLPILWNYNQPKVKEKKRAFLPIHSLLSELSAWALTWCDPPWSSTKHLLAGSRRSQMCMLPAARLSTGQPVWHLELLDTCCNQVIFYWGNLHGKFSAALWAVPAAFCKVCGVWCCVFLVERLFLWKTLTDSIFIVHLVQISRSPQHCKELAIFAFQAEIIEGQILSLSKNITLTSSWV